jgi:peptidoglycan hydrolase-like protein with peptidoglycan-binding domain
MKKLLIVLGVFGALGFAGYRALMNWTVDVNPASIARSMSPEQRAEACRALSGGTEGGYEVCMEGMDLAAQGIQNPAIPDLAQPAEWASYKPGYTLAQRQTWVQSFASNSQPGFGACLYDMVASSIDYSRFLEIKSAIQNDVDPRTLDDFSLAMDDCTNGTFYSLRNGSSASTDSSNSSSNTSSQTTLPYPTETSRYWNAKCPATLRRNDYLPLVKCDKGPGVQHIQQFLGVEADSYFGNDTFNAIVDFQNQNGLRVTGEIDTDTWRLLDPNQTGPGSDLNGDGLVTPDEFR